MYVESKHQENVVKIRCHQPECEVGLLELQRCRGILPKEMFDRWGDALREAKILENEKLYRPYKYCVALMVNDGGELVKESECPNCRRFFCAQSKVLSHDGIECDDFQKLNKDEREKEDIMFMQLANNNKWRRCLKCRIFVDKSHGCMYLKYSGLNNGDCHILKSGLIRTVPDSRSRIKNASNQVLFQLRTPPARN
ncbi:PREDICTED: probable E3 ubiquitin-protein ligase rbrA [Lupinus angustifolius]|uniref:probable E3 ubiquitin-protein ligase rbrA n=1 Tax=Lupinus angustifolius TaxID=3871 RepID=UPI00092F0A19|nr:PREDICTED: probable E3 ubiquitin-protein ligase rbrA [Lupinus angustifolius]